MNTCYAVHDAAGLIVRSGICQVTDLDLQGGTGLTVLELDGVTSDATHYVSGGVVTARAAMGASLDTTTVTADGVDFVTITGVPSGAVIVVNRETMSTSDGSDIELTFDTPGVYQIAAVKWPYLDFEGTVNAT